MKKKTANATPHDDCIISLLKNDAEFAAEYLKTALEEATDKEGQKILLSAVKQIAKAQGLAKIAKRAGIPRESLSRALSPRGNPRLSTIIAILSALGAQLTTRQVST